jgi:hypothetical protein
VRKKRKLSAKRKRNRSVEQPRGQAQKPGKKRTQPQTAAERDAMYGGRDAMYGGRDAMYGGRDAMYGLHLLVVEAREVEHADAAAGDAHGMRRMQGARAKG